MGVRLNLGVVLQILRVYIISQRLRYIESEKYTLDLVGILSGRKRKYLCLILVEKEFKKIYWISFKTSGRAAELSSENEGIEAARIQTTLCHRTRPLRMVLPPP